MIREKYQDFYMLIVFVIPVTFWENMKKSTIVDHVGIV